MLFRSEAIDCQLEGLGVVDDFQLSLGSWLEARDGALVGEASLAVSVSQPSLLKLIPAKVLEALRLQAAQGTSEPTEGPRPAAADKAT